MAKSGVFKSVPARTRNLRTAISASLGVAVSLSASLDAIARDILRPGSGGSNPGAPQGNASQGVSAPGSPQTGINGKDALARISQAVLAVQKMQGSARQAAVTKSGSLGANPNSPNKSLPAVPNGLTAGGLQVAPGVATHSSPWQGASLPTQSSQHGQTTVTINQTAPQALLSWQTFNVGKDTTVNFNQSAGGSDKSKWIAFNKIVDPSGVPSQILGSINAPGQVYLINQNGIIFGGSSQINVHALVASSLPINDNLIARGLLNNPDDQFLFSSLAIPALANGGTTPAFTPPAAPNTPGGRDGDIIVEAGAQLTSPTTPEHVGGKIALIGPNVSNAGTISTPDGQTILAAGNQVALQAHPSSDPSLRGLDVLIGSVDKYSGTVTNTGLIEIPRADLTMAGKSVNQLGTVDSSTSVSLNGRIDLLASYNTVRSIVLGAPVLTPTASGSVVFGANSITDILPELSSTDTVVGTQLALASQINVKGLTIHLANNSDIVAPNANVSLSAGTWLPSNGAYSFNYTNGQVYLDPGATIDVSGSVVSAPISENIVAVQLLGAQLADSPLQRFGPFRGLTIQIDLRETGIYNGTTWVGTPLADASGYVGLIQRPVGELTTAGGTVTVNAGSSVVMQAGSTINVSGGWINYQGGIVQTTRVVTGSELLDISQATPDMVYSGIYTGTFTTSSPKYGLQQTFVNPLLLNGAHYETGYQFGANGGTVSISAPSMALDGTLLGATVSGPRQRTVAPTASALTLNFQGQDATPPLYSVVSPTPPDIVFAAGTTQNPADPFTITPSGAPVALRKDRQAEVILSPDLLTTDGFGNLTINNSDGDISIPSNISLTAPARGSITLAAANLDIQGSVSAPQGTLSFFTFDFSPFQYAILAKNPASVTPNAIPNRGEFTLGASASLSTAGLIVDDRLTSSTAGTLPLATNGGSITIKSYSADLQAGSAIDVSGGVAISATGKLTYGNGGSIDIEAGQDPNIGSLLGGKLLLKSSLLGYAGGRGGSLSIRTSTVQIGGATDNPNTLLLDPAFFSQGGFTSFSISGFGAKTGKSDVYLPGIVIAAGTQIDPVAETLVAQPDPAQPDGIALTPELLSEGLRTPVTLSFSAPGVKDTFTSLPLIRGSFVMETGASIQTDPLATVSIKGDTVAVLGSIIAPGGAITLSGGITYVDTVPPLQPLPTVDLGPKSFLSTSGVTVITPDPTGRGFRTGTVLPGGTITVSGNIVAESGARLDVSGASNVIDMRPAYSTATPTTIGSFLGYSMVSTRVDSNAGSIVLQGAQELFTDATLLGFAGGPTALGGSLTISSGRFYPPDDSKPATPLDVTLTVTQSGAMIPTPFYPAGGTAIGHAVRDGNGKVIAGQGYLAADRFANGGFGSLTLGGTVQFSGPVSITAPESLTVADAGVIFADSAVHLTAPHVTLGTVFQSPFQPQQQITPFQVDGQPYYFPPTYGNGNLTVTASLIDIGNLSLQSIGKASFIALNGDIRGDGTLDVAGAISLTAGQIYPASDVTFTVAAYDYKSGGKTRPGSVTIASAGSRQLPLSAGGTLNIYGSIIEQGGVLRAPLGSINIGWDGVGTAPLDPITNKGVNPTRQVTLSSGSITSVSAVDPSTGTALVIPYGIDLNGTSWIDPAGNDITAAGVPGKTIHIAGATITDQAGATIDLRGGGDLFAYRFVTGIGGTNDILASTSSFAVIPGYGADYAPYAPYNPSPVTNNFGTDPGYVNGTLHVGDRIYLGASTNGLAAGYYTLLPARYALLPGAFLVTPKNGIPIGTLANPDGSSTVSGYRFNDLNSTATDQTLYGRFEVDSQAVVLNRAQYDTAYGNEFLRNGAISNSAAVPRLPIDAGQLVLEATAAMTLRGTVQAQAPVGGQGGLVDISSPADIVIAGSNTSAKSGALVLDASELSNFGAESLLIGGIRHFGPNGTTVSVQAGNVTVDNAGSPLSGPDIILVANKSLTLAPGAQVEAAGDFSGQPESLLFGDSSTPGSGDGALLRVSSNPSAPILRSGVDSSTVPQMNIGAGAIISGASVTLDSTYATHLDPSAQITGTSIALDSGQISLVLNKPGTLQPTAGLVLTNSVLQILENGVQSLSLLSYSSIDLYGTGQIGASSLASLSLHAAEIRGFNNGGGTVTFKAQNIELDGGPGGIVPGPVTGASPAGAIVFEANIIDLGSHTLNIDQVAKVTLTASGGLLVQGTGAFSTSGDLSINTPLITGAKGANQSITAGGQLTITAPAGSGRAQIAGGLGASLTLTGASILDNGNISLPSGSLTLHATSGDLSIGGVLDVSGTSQAFFDVVKYTDGGTIHLLSDTGSITINKAGILDVAAQPGGGNAGSVAISAPQGSFVLSGRMGGQSQSGLDGSFSLDVASLPGGEVGALGSLLAKGGFTQSVQIRDRNDQVVTVDGTITARNFTLSADQGSIDVTGTIDASGTTGGNILLEATGSIILESGSLLTVKGQTFDAAGKGGSISLEAGSETNDTYNPNAVLDLHAGAAIDLSVASNTAASATAGDFTGTLHLRAPQTAGNTDLQIASIDSTILGASSIVVEGYQLYTPAGGSIDSVKGAVLANGTTFAGNATAITSRLLANNGGASGSLASILEIAPGAEIITLNGDLTLTNDWDLSSFRFGPNGAPGVLTLRASGNLVFNGSLSDGFTSSAYNAVLLNQNSLLPANAQSWTYRLTAGADFSAADYHQVQSLGELGANSGSVKLGRNDGLGLSNPTGSNAITATAVAGHYQVIRTGSGDIDISAGRDVQLLNQFATIYTAGTQVADPTMNGTFDTPVLFVTSQGVLGAVQERPGYAAQYSFAGGNVSIAAQGNIEHLTQDNFGNLIQDSEKELPNNWLYRRGYVDPSTGQFGRTKNGDVASTTWWIDFSNFFEGVGALGGGNVTMTAGQDISNVDAVIPTNARMPKGVPNAASMVELGGGDLSVRAGHDINAGAYYVERGHGTLSAGDSIVTNSTRSPSLNGITSPATVSAPETWLPTTLFLGKGSFDVSARGDLLLGPVANPFLMPQGVSNTFWDKTYFSTYSTSDSVTVSSLTGNVTLRESSTSAGSPAAPLLLTWLANVDLLTTNPQSVSYYQPWLRLAESNLDAFTTTDVSINLLNATSFTSFALAPATLRATAFSGDINLVGSLTLSPSPKGTIDLLAAGSINALQPNGVSTFNGVTTTDWGSGLINLSDADPNAIPGIASPFAYQVVAGTNTASAQVTKGNFLDFLNDLFLESGSTEGNHAVLQTKQALHAAGVLHSNDAVPLHIFAADGDISGLTLFSGKSAQVIAGNDLTDIAFYVQNVHPSDVTVISAGRDIIAYGGNSPLELASVAPGNQLDSGTGILAGDIQIAGPGTLELLAGRNLTLGVGPNNPDGTAVGVTSVGNAHNPYLPFAGADIVAAAGLGTAGGLDQSKLDFDNFASTFLASTEGSRYLSELSTIAGTSTPITIDQFRQLPKDQQELLALNIFFLVLRDAGRDHNDPSSPGYQNYNAAFSAISTLFPTAGTGDISLASREIKTESGGNISLLVPGGQVTVGIDIAGNQPLDQGILTEDGGNISIFTQGSVNVGTSRIFTLRGGNEIIWSSTGDIAAGASSKTVQSAPPTRVLVDPQSGDVETDLAGLATGGGIGVLETVVGVPPSNVDLIAPSGTVDAGDAGIRVSGNLNISAARVLNTSNIQVAGTSAGVPATPTIAAPNLAGLTAASTAAGAAASTAEQTSAPSHPQSQSEDVPSIVTVEVIGYGGGEGESGGRSEQAGQ